MFVSNNTNGISRHKSLGKSTAKLNINPFLVSNQLWLLHSPKGKTFDGPISIKNISSNHIIAYTI